MQVENDGRGESAFSGPDIGDVARPLTVGRIGGEVAVQLVCRDTETMVAVSRDLVLACANRLDTVDLHQAPDPTLTNIETCLFQLIVILGRP
jgi:hypothetical protein